MVSILNKKAEKLKRTRHILGSEARSLSDEDKDVNVEGAGEQTEESGSESDLNQNMIAKMTLYWHN